MTRSMDVDVALWSARDALRGVAEASVTGRWLLALLLIKYVSDSLLQDADDKPARFVIPRAADFYFLLNHSDQPGNAKRLDAALRELAAANSSTVGELFDDVTFYAGPGPSGEARDLAFGKVLRLLGSPELKLTRERLRDGAIAAGLGLALAGLVFASSESAGEFYSPPQVGRLMAELLAPGPGDHIYDPACGSGGFLLAARRYVNEHGSRSCKLSGQERSRWACEVATMNLFLHGVEDAQIVYGDSLRNPRLLTPQGKLQRFDVVLANPPFSLSDWGVELAERDRFGRFRYGVPPRSRADYAFIQHMIASMKHDSGRAAVVVPHGVLFRGGSEALIRKHLIEQGLVDAVIGLPPKLFYSSGISTAVLIFRAPTPTVAEPKKEILFIDASNDFALGRRMNELRAEDIERVATAYRRRETEPGYASVVSYEAIAAKEYSLRIPLYVSAGTQQDQLDLDQLMAREHELHEELASLRVAIEGIWQSLGQNR